VVVSRPNPVIRFTEMPFAKPSFGPSLTNQPAKCSIWVGGRKESAIIIDIFVAFVFPTFRRLIISKTVDPCCG
jgi:hypothetical protein